MVNFQKIIAELKEADVSQKELAVFADCTETAIHYLATGKRTDPHCSIGLPIIELHKKKVLNKRRRSN